MELAAECIYAIKRSQDLDADYQSGGRGQLAEGKPWVEGQRLLVEAQKKGVRLPLVFAAAEHTDRGLIYWALIDDIVIDASRRTTVRYSELRPIAGNPPLSTLRLLDAKKRRDQWLADSYIHSYVLCVTPELLREEHDAATETLDVEDLLPVGREGARLAQLHFRRERNRSIVLAKRQQVLATIGRLACEACGFDFRGFYGDLGAEFCEVHHRVPLSEAKAEVETRLEDLAVVCSNCHRMLHRPEPHRPEPFLTVEQLRGRIAEAKEFGCATADCEH